MGTEEAHYESNLLIKTNNFAKNVDRLQYVLRKIILLGGQGGLLKISFGLKYLSFRWKKRDTSIWSFKAGQDNQ